MKNFFSFILAFFITGAASAQTPVNQQLQERYHFAPQKLDKSSGAKTGEEVLPPSEPTSGIRTEGQVPGSIILGTTVYDLQSNSSPGRRLYYYGDGTLMALWTMAFDPVAYPDRGAGYNYFDGSSWLPEPTLRLENERTGWPYPALLNGKDFVMSHDGTNLRLDMVKSNTIGSGDPSDWSTIESDASPGSIWNRIAVNGNTIHCISQFQGGIILDGVTDPFVYTRSTDGGLTWSENILLPNYDTTRTLGGAGADDYDIDANAGKIAIVHGGLGEDVSLWVSTNNGASWTHTYVDSFEYAPDYVTQAPPDVNLPTNDGSVSVVIDDNGKVHVAYAEGVVIVTDGMGFFFPSWIGLRYWTEGMDTAFSIPILAEDLDVDGDGLYTVGFNTIDIAWARYLNNSMLHKPSLSYDDEGNIYIVFSLPQDADTTLDQQSFRDIWITGHKASDPVDVWTKPIDVSNTFSVEEAFATSARKTDDCIHILYQEDFEPGTALLNFDPVTDNNMVYLCVSADNIISQESCSIPINLFSTNVTSSSSKLNWDIASGAIGYKVRYKVAGTSEWTKIQSIDNDKMLKNLESNTEYAWQVKSICGVQPIVSSEWSEKQFFTTSLLRLESESLSEAVQVSPNPFNSSAIITITLQQSSVVNMELYDVTGRKLQTLLNATFDEGNYQLPFNREFLSAGIYFLQVKTDEGVKAIKVVIE